MPMSCKGRERIGRGQRLEIAAIEGCAFGEIGDVHEGAGGARREQPRSAFLR